jgi:hypothetical protein
MVPHFEVRPRSRRNAILVGLGCGIFTIGGLWMIFSGEAILAGLLAVIFFGGGGLYAIPKLLRRDISMVLSSEGIEQQYAQGSTFISWDDVEKIGIVSMFSNKMVSIRLSSYDRYLDDMSPDLAAFFMQSLPYLKVLTRATSLLDAPTAIVLWSKLEGADVSEALKSFGKVGNLAEALMWARTNYGYDLMLSWADVDRSATKFAALLEEYRALR